MTTTLTHSAVAVVATAVQAAPTAACLIAADQGTAQRRWDEDTARRGGTRPGEGEREGGETRPLFSPALRPGDWPVRQRCSGWPEEPGYHVADVSRETRQCRGYHVEGRQCRGYHVADVSRETRQCRGYHVEGRQCRGYHVVFTWHTYTGATERACSASH